MRRLGRATVAVAPTPLLRVAIAGGKGGLGKGWLGKGGLAQVACTVSSTAGGNVVQAGGLPTDQVINFMITDASGTWGFVLGYTPDGDWSVNAPAPNGPTTYEFVSRTYGPNGSKYDVFASCSV
jgi:hypothetical protein